MINQFGDEDTSSLAGWMFADLFLALTVIFLATVSFIPANSGIGVSSKSSIVNNFEIDQKNEGSRISLISNGFVAQYSINQVNRFKQDVQNYLRVKEIPIDTTAIYLQVICHTSDYGVKNDTGNINCLRFIINSTKAQKLTFVNTNTSIDLSPDVPKNFVKVKVTFS